ncbi:hypothetical protein ACVWW1_004155 [Bradyrhizobium sp. JR3.5]
MTNTIEAPDGGYRFMPGVSQYSCGVGALPGYAIERVRFSEPAPLSAGFERIAEIIRDAGRPLTAFAACELRSPAPFTEDGFKAFNEIYIKTLIAWGVMRDGVNPVARSNVCPKLDPPAEPSFHAFCYTVPGRRRTRRRASSSPAAASRSRARPIIAIILSRPATPARLASWRRRNSWLTRWNAG